MFEFRSTLTFCNKSNIHCRHLKFAAVTKPYLVYSLEFFHKNVGKRTSWIYRPKSDNLVQFSRMFEFRSTLTFCNKSNIHGRHLKFSAMIKQYPIYSLEFSHKNKRKRARWSCRPKLKDFASVWACGRKVLQLLMTTNKLMRSYGGKKEVARLALTR